jgi:hypothetical protein
MNTTNTTTKPKQKAESREQKSKLWASGVVGRETTRLRDRGMEKLKC